MTPWSASWRRLATSVTCATIGIPCFFPSSTIAAITSGGNFGLVIQILMTSTFCAFRLRTFARASSGVVGLNVGAPGYGPLTLKPWPAVYAARREERPASRVCRNSGTVSGLSFPADRIVVTPHRSCASQYRFMSSGGLVDVAVRVDEARHQDLAVGVDDRRRRAAPGPARAVLPRESDRPRRRRPSRRRARAPVPSIRRAPTIAIGGGADVGLPCAPSKAPEQAPRRA